ncbi:surfactant B protein, putative [Trichomonas vaginalis G3]|uniref:Surfactant B protein, putative n=1 Tax=Trichomonas vaginalis (strain ATCC PRA-98 / G3) TaxID=412133 RepID=A2DNF1_TRIV3|nr:saposin family [Trichomonas vaginalis G3]EAY18139.1 surfactant B protein, putative [Trichomonas vaginalis G3]KAI5492416.1 saposin family [Trichomonas vaginalis G3]|eukprot:XP_001579125.1 surfactant B protein [Trichomonas vaginalis G3]
MFFLFALFAASAMKPRKSAPVNDWSPMCLSCKLVVSIIEKELKSGKKIEEITEKVEAYCAYLQGDAQQICIEIVKEKVPEIIKYIEKEMESHDVCKILDYCK